MSSSIRRGRLIETSYNLSSKSSDNLVVAIHGFSEFAYGQFGWKCLYSEQIEDLLQRGYDVMPCQMPNHTSNIDLMFSNPWSAPERLRDALSYIYDLNGGKPFQVLAFSTAAITAIDYLTREDVAFLKGLMLVSPAFKFRKSLLSFLGIVLGFYYFLYLVFILAAVVYNPLFVFGLPFVYLLRAIWLPKEKSKSDVPQAYYPLISSAQLLLLQYKIRASIKKHGLARIHMSLLIGGADHFIDSTPSLRLLRDDLKVPTVIVENGSHNVLLANWRDSELQRAWGNFFPRLDSD